MTYISRCEHGTPMALCQKCFPDVSEQNDWAKYINTHSVKELDEDFDAICLENKRLQAEIEALKVKAHEWYLIAMGKAQEK